MKEIMTDVVMLIVIATAIILGAWGLKSLYDSEEISDKALNEVSMIVDKYKNDTELNQCTKYLFDKNMKITRKTRKNYSDCITKIIRNRTEQELRQIIGGE